MDCGRRTIAGPRCEQHTRDHEAQRNASAPLRAVYRHPIYRASRRAVFARAGGRCEWWNGAGERCPARARECHHLRPIVRARTMDEALAWSVPEAMVATCVEHHPRGPDSPAGGRWGPGPG